MSEITPSALVALCKRNKLFSTPHLNSKLYANFQGFVGGLASLAPYSGLQSLFLEGNALETIADLPPLPELRCLFLQQNGLTTLAPAALARLPHLDTLNVAGNALGDLGGLAGCAALRTLVASDNQLADVDAVAPGLAACTHLESLDLQNNRLEEGEALLAALARLPRLKCLYLRGNPLASSLRSYRKAVVAALPGLTYLDDRPVFELERLCAEAWASGGLEAEREARAAFHQREREREQCQVAALREIREAGWRKRREAMGLDPERGDPDLEGLPCNDDLLAEAEQLGEPHELRQARARLAAFTAPTLAGGDACEGLPALVEADVQAVLEDNHASQAALLQDGPLQPGSRRSSGSGGQPGPRASRPASAAGSADAKSRENACPNSPPTAPPAVVNCGTPAAAAVPEARVTVTIGDSCTAPASSPAETEQLGEGQATQVEVAGSGVAPAAALPLAEGAGPQLEAAGGGEGETGSLDAAGDFDDLDALD